jgi:FtsP/CotA-like multicopper oxidase with cupredoxin domain
MSRFHSTRRNFLKATGAAFATLLSRAALLSGPITSKGWTALQNDGPADYSLTIATTPIELAPNRMISVTTYNGQFPGPLLRLKEGERVTIEIRNDTDTPEQLHWHGQFVSTDVDGAAEEGTPFIPPHGSRRISFVPKPAGFRSITPTSGAEPIWRRASTADWSGLFTLSRSSTQGTTTAKSFSH